MINWHLNYTPWMTRAQILELDKFYMEKIAEKTKMEEKLQELTLGKPHRKNRKARRQATKDKNPESDVEPLLTEFEQLLLKD
jgi:hypothetical protein